MPVIAIDELDGFDFAIAETTRIWTLELLTHPPFTKV
jgi:hypothetical protein